MKAEYKGVVVATCKAVWLKRILKDLDVFIKDPILLYWDNLYSTYLDWNLVLHTRTRHIEVHYHFIRERVLARDVDLQRIDTSLHTVDLFMKELTIFGNSRRTLVF